MSPLFFWMKSVKWWLSGAETTYIVISTSLNDQGGKSCSFRIAAGIWTTSYYKQNIEKR